MLMVPTRRAKASLLVGGIDVLGIMPGSSRVISFGYEDNTSDKLDSIKVNIADPERTWMMAHMPEEGIECKASFSANAWRTPFDFRVLECGTFWIDEIDCSGPPNAIDIKGNSAPVPTGIKDEKKSRSWEGVDIRDIQSRIASEHGLEAVWDVEKTPEKVKRTDQIEKTDMGYFRDKCKEAGLSIKIHNKQLIVYSEKEYEARPSSFVFAYGSSNILSWNFALRLADVYAEAEAAYVNPETGKLTKVKVSPKDVPKTKSKLAVNERLAYGPDDLIGGGIGGSPLRPRPRITGWQDWDHDDPASNNGKGKNGRAAAKGKAEKKLKDKNKKHKCFELQMVGDPAYLSGLNAQIVGFGVFDDKYFLESVSHDIDNSGYTCKLKMRKAISEY
jgi:phage protein D